MNLRIRVVGKLLFGEMRNDEELKNLLHYLKTFSRKMHCIN